MKTLLSLVLAWQSVGLLAQTSGVNSNPQHAERQISTPSVVERGPHHRTWERVELVPGPEGKLVEQRRSYQELATGLHFKNERGEWEESQEKIELLPNDAGAIAAKGQHKAIFPPELKSGLIELQLPDQKWMRSRVWGLAYFDSATGESVLLAEVKESEGRVIGDNVVLYPNAFTDLRADVRYVYTRAKFEQDVILREQPPRPEDFGLNPETTRLQVLTEFVEAGNPDKQRRLAGGMADESLRFGAMTIGAGRAFSVEDTKNLREQVPVAKSWDQIEGRTFLLEEALYHKVLPELSKLPAAKQDKGASLHRRGKGKNSLLALKAQLPKRYAKNPNPADARPRLMARATPRTEPGFVLDYVTVNTGVTNYTFKGDTTYYITDPVVLSGTTVIEGGTVIKYATTANGYLEIEDGVIDCQTAPYRPAVFTSKDDNSVGETIAGSSGTPGAILGTGCLISFWGVADLRLSNVRMSYIEYPIYFWGDEMTISDAQFYRTAKPIYFDGNSAAIKNVLIHEAEASPYEAALSIYSYSTPLSVEHLTVNKCGNLLMGYSYPSASFTNCLFVSVTNWGSSFTSVNCATNASSSAVFQTVGGGAHYLTTNSPYRNAGTTNIDPILLARLRQTTTYPPIAYTNVTFTVPVTFSPQAQRDTDTPDLGYHYDPLDYSLGGCTANTNLTFTAGTAVGWFRTTSGWYHAGQAIRMTGTTVVTFDGTATAPTYFVRLNTVQENDKTAGYGHAGISNWESSSAPTVRGKFLRCTAMATEIMDGYFSDDYGGIRAEMTHTEFWSGTLSTYGDLMYYTNCLFWRLRAIGAAAGGVGSEFVMRNCTMYGGYLFMSRSGPMPVLVQDSAFDGTTISMADGYGSNATYTKCDYNAYTNASNPFPIGGANDVTSVVFDWQDGALGSFYQPSGSSLVDEGSVTADAIGLYHFTTRPDGQYYKEYNSQVDIGYHYVEVDGNGWPLDYDGDGTPDYLEDANGNGTVNSGETDWQSGADYGLRIWITEPKRSSNLP